MDNSKLGQLKRFLSFFIASNSEFLIELLVSNAKFSKKVGTLML